MRGRWVEYFCFPLISLVSSGLAVLIITLVASVFARGFQFPGAHVILIVLAIVFSGLLVIGQVDSSLYDSSMGFRVGRFLHMVRRDTNDLAYEKQAKGAISKGTETIDVALTILWVVILVVGG